MLLELSWCEGAKSLARALVSMRVQPQEDSIRWELLRDNRDLEVVVGWEPSTDDKDPRRHEETRACMFQLLAARNLILRIIAATAEEQDLSSLLSKLSQELETLNNERIPKSLEKFLTADKRVRVESILVPMDAVERLRETYDSQQLIVIARLADSFSKFSRPDSKCIEIIRNAHCLKTLPIPTTDEPVSYKDFLLRAATCGETLSFLGIMCASFINQAHPEIGNKKNRKKSNKDVESFTADDIEVKYIINHVILYLKI